MIKNKINTFSREVIVVGTGDSAKNFLKYDPAISVVQNKLEYSLFLLCKDKNEDSSIYFLVLKPKSLHLSYRDNTFYDVYNRKGSENIVSFPQYTDGEILKVGYLDKNISYKSIMEAQGFNLDTKILINNMEFENIYMFDLNEKNRARVVSSTADATNQTFISRWI